MPRSSAFSCLLVCLCVGCARDWSDRPDPAGELDAASADASVDSASSEPPDGSTPPQADTGVPGSQPDAEPDAEPDATANPITNPITSGPLSGRSAAASGRCVELTLNDSVASPARARTSKLSVVPENLGRIFADANCTQMTDSVTIAATASEARFYLKTALAEAEVGGELTVTAMGDVAGSKKLELRRAALGLSVGENYVCAVLDNGALYCWGLALRAGEGVPGDVVGVPVKVPLPAGERAVSVAAGVASTCTVTQSGKVFCWGDNRYGQLGVGGDEDTGRPQQLTALSQNVTRIAVGEFHACAVQGGALLCWGDNGDGQTGHPVQPAPNDVIASPTVVPGFASGVVDVSCGFGTTCVALQNGSVSCFGELPFSLPAGGSPARVSGFGPASCLLRDGIVQCRGKLSTRLDWGTSYSALSALGTGVSELSVGSQHACAIKEGKVYCFGSNVDNYGVVHGAVGGTDAPDTTQPRLVPEQELPGIATLVSTSHSYTWSKEGTSCAVADGLVYCWGSNITGELGDTPSLGSYPKAQRVRGFDGMRVDDIYVAGAYSGAHVCAISAGKAYCWGSNSDGQLGKQASYYASSSEPAEMTFLRGTVKKLSLGLGFSCALVGDEVHCWGANGSRQAGEAGGGVSANRITFPGTLPAVDIAAGGSHACAVVRESEVNRAVYCWGDQREGRLGDGVNKSEGKTPVKVALSSANVSAVATAADNTCAVTNGGVQCWGKDYFTQGMPPTYPVVSISSLPPGGNKTLANLSMTGAGACAISESNLLCWSPWEDASAQSTGVARMTAGVGQVCGVGSDGVLSCAGANESGQLGRGTFVDSDAYTPVMGLVAPVKAIATGGSPHGVSCAVDAEGVKCWGSNIGRIIAAAPLARTSAGLIARWEGSLRTP